MRIRVLGQLWHASLILQWLLELCVVLATLPIAFRIAKLWLTIPEYVVASVTFTALIALSMAACGMYSRRQREGTVGISVRLVLSVIVGAAAAYWLVPPVVNRDMTAEAVLLAAGFALVALATSRVVATAVLGEGVLRRRVIVLGAGRRASAIAKLRRRSDRRGFRLLGSVAVEGEEVLVGDTLIEKKGTLLQIARAMRADEIIVAVDDRRRYLPTRELIDCRLEGVQIVEIVQFLERETGKVQLDLMHPSWIIFAEGFRRDFMRRFSERSIDLFVSLMMTLLLWPIMLLTVIAIKIEDGPGAPAIYAQPRVGLRGRIFDVLKFRSMRTDAESDGKARWAAQNDTRITRVGAFIRRVRIDELPQILNVLKGDMSLVGPRPERPQFVTQLAEKIPYYRERHSVKPGITGWAQLCHSYGGSDEDAVQKLQYDLFYVKNNCLIFDIMIILRTCEIVLFGRGVR